MNCCQHGSSGNLQSYDDVVQAYLRDRAPAEERYVRFYQIQRSLAEAIGKAAMAELPNGNRFSHQRRIPGAVLKRFRDVLLNVQWNDCRSFQELYDVIRTAKNGIRGIGPLTTYDTAHRLGAYLRLSPEYVYLHAGVRSGAKALGIGTKREYLKVEELPRAFQRLRPEQIEDCLCIYKRELEKIGSASSS